MRLGAPYDCKSVCTDFGMVHPLSYSPAQEQLVTNALQYYLTMAELEKDESY